jgi:CO dehydrogenase nickel-insertion accessory protein CooC1
MSTRAAINGSGGSGRTVLRSAIEREAERDMIAVSDVVDADADALAHLLRVDSLPSTGASLTCAQKRSDLRRRLANGGSHGERPACTVERGKESRAGDANPYMTLTHPSVAGLIRAVPFA